MKILILSASPQRDKVPDDLIAGELRKQGHDVWVKPCLREGRKSVLELKPDIVVAPPIRNVYSRDFVRVLKSWGIAVASRHTEASCDWPDFKALPPHRRDDILGRYPYQVDVEIVWGPDEAQILNRRPCGFPAVSVGAFALDIYFQDGFRGGFPSRENFNKKHKFDDKKKNLLVGSPWGFGDSAPDLRIDETKKIKEKEIKAQKRHLKMLQYICKNLDWNVLLRPHPDVLARPYVEAARKLGIPVDFETPATELLVNMDAIVHSGSTMALEAHCLDIPAFQYGDVNTALNWWVKPKSLMSKVSKIYKKTSEMVADIDGSPRKSNANLATIKELEEGRYGPMDGQAAKRAADIIGKLKGGFKMCWPDSTINYSQLTILQSPEDIVRPIICNICNKKFVTVTDEWLDKLRKGLKLDETVRLQGETVCPHCGARFYRNEQ